MKILVSNKLKSIANALAYSGFTVYIHDKTNTSTFDAFDRLEPQIIMIDDSYVDDTVIKCLMERPHLKIALFVNHFSKSSKDAEARLNNSIGDNYIVTDYISIYDPVICRNAYYDKKYAARMVVVETEPIDNIETLEVSDKLKIFSTCRVIDHFNFCGIITPEEIPYIFGSSTNVLTNFENVANAQALGCNVKTSVEDFKNPILISEEFFKPKKQPRDSFLFVLDVLKMLRLEDSAKAVEEKRKEFI